MQRIFAADIGGTNARFALFSAHKGRLALAAAAWGKSTDLGNTQDVLQAMQQLLERPFAAGDALAVAIAGPVDGLRGKLTNGQLQVDLIGATQRHNFARCLLLNDFSAQAFATLAPCGATAVPVRAGLRPADGSFAARAVLGAGTGLGAAMLVRSGEPPSAGSWLAVPTEAGHTAFPFVGAEEHAYQTFLARERGHCFPTAENVLSGEGLSALHYHLSGHVLPPPAIGAEALSRETLTLAWYARFLGRFCRQWMLTSLCRGGLWIAGGIAAKNPLCVKHPSFLRELGMAADVDNIASAAPIHLINDENSGLWGAARAVLEYLPRSGADAAKIG